MYQEKKEGFLPALMSAYDLAKIYNLPDNTKSRRCGKRYEKVNDISELNNRAQKKYKNIHDWVGKAIYRELFKIGYRLYGNQT